MRNIIKLLRIKFILQITPLIGIFIISSFLFYYLKQEKDPSMPASALLNKKVPEIKSSDLLLNNINIDNDIFFEKKVLINFFASWCAPCEAEHTLLLKISNNHKDIFLLGINYKDDKNDAIKFLEDGNPYNNIAVDNEGKIAMNFGVYGLPETFIVNKSGIIIFKHVGPITKKLYDKKIKNLLSN